jgi:hypothetical protein
MRLLALDSRDAELAGGLSSDPILSGLRRTCILYSVFCILYSLFSILYSLFYTVYFEFYVSFKFQGPILPMAKDNGQSEFTLSH